MKENPQYRGFEIGDVIGQAEIMMRLHPKKKEAISRLNEAIQFLTSSGAMETIFNKYR